MPPPPPPPPPPALLQPATPVWLQRALCHQPALPIPSLAATLAGLARSVAAVSPTEADFRASVLRILDFMKDEGGEGGPALQAALLNHARGEDAAGLSYLIRWWNRLAYTSWRLPLPLNVSYWFLFANDAFRGIDLRRPALEGVNTHRAAALVLAAADARDALWAGTFPVEAHGGATLCPRMYRYIFHACRLPRVGEDGIRVYDGVGANAPGDFIVVLRKGRPFVVSLLAGDSAAGARASEAELTARLRGVVSFADGTLPVRLLQVGVLTASHRDIWAAALPLLAGQAAPMRPSHGVDSPVPAADDADDRVGGHSHPNLAALTTIESALLVLCMDGSPPPPPTAAVVSASRNLLDGNASNRWYDKAVQLVVYDDGVAGFIGEHSHCDGMPTAHVLSNRFKWAVDAPRGGRGGSDDTGARIAALSAGVPPGNRISPPLPSAPSPSSSYSSHRTLPAGTEELVFHPPAAAADAAALRQLLHQAAGEVAAQAVAHELHVVTSAGYGGSTIKADFRASPDAWAQMAMQLAHFRWKGRFAATYEPAHARRFAWGRTACIRTVTPESCAWARAMVVAAVPSLPEGPPPSPPPAGRASYSLTAASVTNLASLLKAATAAHGAAVRAALAGRDIDRHLLGLKMVWRKAVEGGGGGERGAAAAALFTDASVSASSTWLLSTSNLTAPFIENWGFGEVCEGGLGVAYSTGNGALRFNIVGEAAASPGEFAAHLRWALEAMAAVGQTTSAAAAPTTARPKL